MNSVPSFLKRRECGQLAENRFTIAHLNRFSGL